MGYLRTTADAVFISVRVQPAARRTQLVGLHGDALKIKIAAPPEDGKANQELCDFLSEILGVTKRAVSVSAGTSSRSKSVRIEGLELSQVSQKLDALLAATTRQS